MRMKASAVTWIWDRWRLFLGHIAIFLVVVFMTFYVNDRQFFLTHHLSLPQADGTFTPKLVYLPVQSDITTIISILASAARLASTLWVVGVDLRCVFLFMERGGVTFEGMKSMIGGLPGYDQFRQKRNYFFFITLQVAILTSAFSSSVISGSVTWKPASKYLPGQPMEIPLVQNGDPVYGIGSSTALDSIIGYCTTIYSVFYDTSISSSMHRLIPEVVRPLPNGTRFGELIVPYFSIDAFEWIKDPNSTLSLRQLNTTIQVNITGPRIMTKRKFGLIPDESWGPSEGAFPSPLTISESRILVISGFQNSSQLCDSNSFGPASSTIPLDVQPYLVTLNAAPSCLIFANVTYRAGAARCRTCQLLSPKVVRDVGDVRDLELVEDSVTSVALALAPYLSTSIFDIGYAIPYGPAFPTMQAMSIELLSRSYQVTWNALISMYGFHTERSNVFIVVDAPRASVMMWRVALWSILHAILVALGFVFRHIHTNGHHPWIEDPVITALLVDPTSLMDDPSTWAGKDAPPTTAKLELQEQKDKKFITLEWQKISAGDPDQEEFDTSMYPLISRV